MMVQLTCHACGKEFQRETRNHSSARAPMKTFCKNKCSVEWHRAQRRKRALTPTIFRP